MIQLDMDHPLSKSFPAKLILFGEYAVLLGADSLAIPFHGFSMRLKFYQCKSHEALVQFNQYFNQIIQAQEEHLYKRFDVALFAQDLSAGLSVASTIPMGAGMGSSGALIALLYDRYVREPASDFETLKKELACMESCFHGTSSGIDPLVIFVQKPMYITNAKPTALKTLGDLSRFFVFHSGVERNTQQLVQMFKTKLTDSDFSKQVQERFISLNNELIQCLLENRLQPELFKQLSLWQFEYMHAFIPEAIRNIWKQGLEQDAFYLKICGAGGGGFFMGYSVTSYPSKREILKLV